ncbi:ABC transporter substrate-binding protein [Streptomyces sp. NA04227]|uniref:bifunctional serine/threonine-protein kinase/ABC transporter substrate-binding protein n=1 Tax=Streptomyces sp. NA04227 TaxID=2742136 RepID=UPI00159194E8|nr:bifunctional serine/threonine-protein kinase/ABC transporter substrate-binding protein [Streptomyces sp. NA04227]QKW05384.1 ABC transporter substrate-binding protein [Streptomyces sp. NA04227]
MRALRTEDPAEIGGHRLLARLGAGGMGVVYLARTALGELVALKVVRAEHAADPAFRARFRREAALAGRLTGRWTVPVRASDADAREPWLTTDFVAGPSLAEAVAACGPLPAASVLALGARLAEALAEVHATGLVHRDVKPGNLLLTREGPRLIDFGIAHSTGATALTSADTIIGTPGYLSPEQTRMYGGQVGPPSDLFSLGCVLVYAATSRPPFGGGDALAVLYRTLHEAPDLGDLRHLPSTARELIARCLSREATDRPTAGAVAAALAAPHAPVDPRESGTWGRQAPVTDGTGAGGEGVADGGRTGAHRSAGEPPASGPGSGVRPAPEDADHWLPPAVLRLVADRAARALDPPERAEPAHPGSGGAEPATVPQEEAGTRPPSRSRRRFLLAGGAALAATGAAAALALGRRSSAGGDDRVLYRIGLQTDLTGPLKGVGEATRRGALLAVDAHNSRTDAPFRVALRVADDQGRAEGARAAARTLLSGPTPVSAVIGPTSEVTLTAAEPAYTAAGSAIVLASYDGGAMSPTAKHTLYVTRATQLMQAVPLLYYLTSVRSVSRTAVVHDRAGGSVAQDLVRDLTENPPNEGTTSVHPVDADRDDFTAAVSAALATRPGAVVYAGTSPRRAARVARLLSSARFAGARVGIEQAMGPAFVHDARKSADGWVFGCARTDTTAATSGPAARFAAAHRERFGSPPAPWAAEAYDAVGLLAHTLATLHRRDPVTPGVLSGALLGQRYEGVAKTLGFDPQTRLLTWKNTSFLYEARAGAFRFLGRYEQVRRQ